MLQHTLCAGLFLIVVFGVIPQWTLSTPLIRSLRSPSTTPESHISNFLHQHRSDSRADKPELKPFNSSDPLHRRPAKPKSTTTEAPVSQTELLVNLIHNTIQTVRDQFPALTSAISSPKDPPSTTKNPRKLHHSSHAAQVHSMQERSTNETFGEDTTESAESSEGSGDEEEVIDEELDGEEIPQNNNPLGFIPPALIRTIVEASGSSAARGSAGASAGSAASASAGVVSSSSSGSGRNTRQTDEQNQENGGGSADFVVSIFRNKIRALASLFFSPILSASTFAQRSISGVLSSSSGITPEPDPRQRHSGEHRHDHNSHHHSDDHHHHHGHDHRSEDHHSDGHHSEGHGLHHSGDHSHHSNEHDHINHNHTNTTVDDSANLILGSDDSSRKLFYRDAPYNAANATTSNGTKTEDPRVKEPSSDDAPLRIVLFQGTLDAGGIDDDQKIIVRKTREAKILSEGFGIYILEIFGSIAGLTWGALHQITHLFQRRSDESDDFY